MWASAVASSLRAVPGERQKEEENGDRKRGREKEREMGRKEK